MQNIELIPVFGNSFTVYVPIIMSVVALITLFDGLSRILKLFGIETEDSVQSVCLFSNTLSEEDEEKIKNGTAIILAELKQEAKLYNKAKSQLPKDEPVTTNYANTLLAKSIVPPVEKSVSGIRSITREYTNLYSETIDEDNEFCEDNDNDSGTIDFTKFIEDEESQSPIKRTKSDEFKSFSGKSLSKPKPSSIKTAIISPQRTSIKKFSIDQPSSPDNIYRGRYADD
jgi:nitrogen fixation/metabolism regulation signal transduction histidine kinase